VVLDDPLPYELGLLELGALDESELELELGDAVLPEELEPDLLK